MANKEQKNNKEKKKQPKKTTSAVSPKLGYGGSKLGYGGVKLGYGGSDSSSKIGNFLKGLRGSKE
jgi:hypothetical protein